MNRYQKLFLGNCFSCNDFGHKYINCGSFARNDPMKNRSSCDAPRDNILIKKSRNSQGNRNYNPFS